MYYHKMAIFLVLNISYNATQKKNNREFWNAVQCIRLKMNMNVRAKKTEPYSSTPSVLHLLFLNYQRPVKAMHISLCVKGLAQQKLFVQQTPRFEVYIP